MKFGRFQHQNRTFYGLVEGDQVVELDGSPFGSYKANGQRHALSALKILTPCEPRNFYCTGLNYAAHIEWADRRKGLAVKLPEKADVGYRSPNALATRDDARRADDAYTRMRVAQRKQELLRGRRSRLWEWRGSASTIADDCAWPAVTDKLQYVPHRTLRHCRRH